jgi:aminoglycoside/choline kinase family phosphotransferase
LNLHGIDITLKIIDRMAKMHSKFWNKNLKIRFTDLKKSDDIIFRPFFTYFINKRYDAFKEKWFKILTNYQKEQCDKIYKRFDMTQESFSNGNNLTFIHGDIKSPNIFYDIENDCEPYFIDWQHCAIGKGAQDLIFFIVESFDIINIKSVFNIAKEYYYKKIIEYGVTNYSFQEYEHDIYDALCYIPFFTGIWFGTTSEDELIDKNFPYFFISKLFYLIELLHL